VIEYFDTSAVHLLEQITWWSVFYNGL